MSAASSSTMAGRLALVVLSVPVFVACCELVLWSLDLGRSAQVADLSRGFDDGVARLVPNGSAPGAWRTNVFEDPEKEVVIPSRDGRRRVLLFGGSNTQIFPEQLLQSALNRVAPEPGWEVLNLGRQGYGSQRVRALLAQAMVLEPDVVVIYSGHNEFVELNFLAELTSTWERPWERAVVDRLSGLRSFGVVVEAFSGGAHGAGTPATPRKPEPLQRPDHAARQLAWGETLKGYDAYQHNLSGMVDTARAVGAQVVLCTLVSNLLSPPLVATWSDEQTPEEIAAFEALRAQAVSRLPPDCRASLSPPVRLRLHDWYDGPSASAAEWTPPDLRPLLDALADAPASEEDEAASVEGAHWPAPAGWNDDVRALVESIAACVRPTLDDRARERLHEADALLVEALDIVPDNPRAWFDRGLVALLLGDEPAARDALARAAQWDRAPSSANLWVNEIVREVADGVSGVTLVDAEALFASRCPGGLVGYEVMMDSCHLQPGARVILMQDLAQVILQLPPPAAR